MLRWDNRNFLYLEVVKIVKHKRPDFILIENVKGLQSFLEGVVLEKILNELRTCGYIVEWKVLNAKDFGVSQSRERLFIVANNKGIKNFFIHIEKYKTKTPEVLKNIIGTIEELDTLPNHYINNNINQKNKLIISKISQGQKLCNTRLGNRSIHTWQIPEVFGETTAIEKKILYAIAKHRRKKCYIKKESWSDANPLTINEINSIVGKEFKNPLLFKLIC